MFGLVWNGMVWYGAWVLSRYSSMQNLSSWFEKQLSYTQFMEIWFGLVLNCMVYGYCLAIVACKISSSWLEKQQENQQSYGWVKEMLFGLVWFGFGMVRFSLGLNGMVHGYC